jgi:hypothetical protein
MADRQAKIVQVAAVAAAAAAWLVLEALVAPEASEVLEELLALEAPLELGEWLELVALGESPALVAEAWAELVVEARQCGAC